MATPASLEILTLALSPQARILSNPSSSAFKNALSRWTEINLQTPAAIVMCASEADAINAVKWSLSNNVPFVPKSGGHSQFSTVGSDGVVLDLSPMGAVVLDEKSETATLCGGVLEKEVAVALAAAERWTPAPNANSVGVIPYFLNGGTNVASHLVGYASDQITAARIITATGDLVVAHEKSNADLLWALRGAGLYFGVVTQLTIRIYPFASLGNEDGTVWHGIFAFPFERALEVAQAMEKVIANETIATSGLMMAANAPPEYEPGILVSTRLTDDPARAPEAFKPLYDLEPIRVASRSVPIADLNDGLDVFCGKGDFKRFSIVGVPHYSPERWVKTVHLWKELQDQCEDARSTTFNFQWHSRFPVKPPFDSANSIHDVCLWQNNFIWYRDASSHDVIDQFDKKALAVMRETEDTEQFRDFPNGVRTVPAEQRFRPQERLAKLKALKLKWDPKGVFTRELL